MIITSIKENNVFPGGVYPVVSEIIEMTLLGNSESNIALQFNVMLKVTEWNQTSAAFLTDSWCQVQMFKLWLGMTSHRERPPLMHDSLSGVHG